MARTSIWKDVHERSSGFFCEGRPSKAVHPLDPSRSWFLLYDTVHLLKSLRNNWITEGSKKVTFDGETFADI